MWELTESVSWKIKLIFLLFCAMVDIISAVQFNVPLAPLPKKMSKKVLKKSLAFFTEVLQKSCSSCELLDYTDDICLPKL